MEALLAGGDEAGLPQRREDLPGLAVFTLDGRGLITAWPESAIRLFGLPVRQAAGQHVCDVLLTGPGQRGLMVQAMAEVAAGRPWTSTVAGGRLGEGRFAIRCEPAVALDGNGDAVVTAWRAWPQSAPGWLAEAAARIGSTLDMAQTAAEVAGVAVPGFADVAVIYVAERLLAGGEPGPSRAGSGTAVRRMAGVIAGHSAAITEGLMPADEVIIFDPLTPGDRAMATGEPVLYDQLDGQTAERLNRRGGREVVAGYTSFLAMPLAARGSVLGCALFARTADSPPFTQGDIALAAELAARAAVCIDNARLYHREQRTALALQRGLLPSEPDVPAGLDVAHRYLAV